MRGFRFARAAYIAEVKPAGPEPTINKFSKSESAIMALHVMIDKLAPV
jgi:hypothetical protein